MDNESRFNAFAHTFKYRSPLWIESDSDLSKSSRSRSGGGLSGSEGSIDSNTSDSSGSVNNYLDSKIPEHHQSTASDFSDGGNAADDNNEAISDDERAK
ncbi:unnamed protein product [Parnassius apollo]|uniref:(apollo) hypothetical protein n=1 Tax=Parnassius apollo TaxID=110799 RepID=A0A8S3Y9T1_PARAO|nr:unnamed protein product [Parnassius apollo]